MVTAKLKRLFIFSLIVLVIIGGIAAYRAICRYRHEKEMMRRLIRRLEADTRIAEVLVTDIHFNEPTRAYHTTIKFLEYDSKKRPLEPKYFTFSGNIIQFQSLVIRFEDRFIKEDRDRRTTRWQRERGKP